MPRLSAVEKAQVALSALKHANEIKHLLIRRYWQTRKTATVSIAGKTLTFDTSDFLSNTIFWQGEFADACEPATSDLLARLIRQSNVYADVGGNIGYFSILPAVINPDCRIYYFEIDATIKPIVLKNMTLNDLDPDRIVIVNAAVGDGDDELNFRPHSNSFLAKLSGESLDNFDCDLIARTITLDGYFKTQGVAPDLLKIDVDGAELAALRGMRGILNDVKPDMLLEVHPPILLRMGSSASEVHRLLREFGYLFFKMQDFRKGKMAALTQIYNFDSLVAETGEMLFVTQGRQHGVDERTPEFRM